MVYQIEVLEQTSKIYDIEAESESEAIEIAETRYENKELNNPTYINKKTSFSEWY